MHVSDQLAKIPHREDDITLGSVFWPASVHQECLEVMLDAFGFVKLSLVKTESRADIAAGELTLRDMDSFND